MPLCLYATRVILSGVAASRSEAAAQSKDPYQLKGSVRSSFLLLCWNSNAWA